MRLFSFPPCPCPQEGWKGAWQNQVKILFVTRSSISIYWSSLVLVFIWFGDFVWNAKELVRWHNLPPGSEYIDCMRGRNVCGKNQIMEVVKIFCLAPKCSIPKWNKSLRVNLSCCSILSSREPLFFSTQEGAGSKHPENDIFTSGQWYSSTQLTFQGLGRITQIAWTRKTPHFFWQ